ncbi:response regulator [Mesorhizobium sp. M7A.F.Ca.CA.001.09.2.1]|uniref:Response regulator n=1 Tax=Mesorhizobium ciceri TaxID=39645 RepID=A0AB38TJV7_9HYPH|nr:MULTISPECIES: response regulator [Mesorhizobium]RUY35359.1 response regulator [Mesorhizobium sp. M7A.F.Ca.CA.001.13.2.1]MDF3217284.1 response regulator [Mesorhizobium ciceri]RUY61391.1 response regulator [Mesorhizobium sp. M7A.F.Ca.CA.001.05.1.1]RUY63305.1 response regulator [Mesorhizobium sp. M7A.F.Ca.CA.001.13.1.1]RUY79968.1 response regulator [Mesorhizobium sp. M7A.F.Ca.CA.001.09.2.1]
MNSGAVLVVEDESLILLDIEHSLREAGFEVIAVYKGDNAIATFDRNPDRVAALLTDIRIGEGPTGWDVARHMRTVNPSLPVIYMSGDGAEDWPSLGVPNSLMITKPFVMPQIITGLANLLNSQAGLAAPG